MLRRIDHCVVPLAGALEKMSLAEKLEAKRTSLKHVSTVITKTDGKKFVEHRSDSGAEELVKIGESYGFCVDNSPDEGIHCVVENLFIASQDGAHNYKELTEKKITHIVNVATGVINPFPNDFLYKTMHILDLPEENITDHFPELFPFIEQGVKDGATLVHCNAGISRSSTVVIAFLMFTKTMSLEQAFLRVKHARPAAKPNEGFWRQLQDYEQKLLDTMKPDSKQ